MAKSITAGSGKGGVLLQSWVQFVALTSLKKFVTGGSVVTDSSEYDSSRLLNSGALDRKTHI